MSKYTQLTTTADLNVGGVVYSPAHGGQKPSTIISINHENNAIKTIYSSIYDRIHNDYANGKMPEDLYNNSLEWFQSQPFSPVSYYYHKHIPKPRAKKPEPVESEEPDQRNTPRTPDMYDFDF